MENNSIHQRRFEAAVKVMRTLPADGVFVPSDDMLITFYSYYRQATDGACNSPRPCSQVAPSRAEWEAWKALGAMSKEEAMKAYVEEILLILEMIPVTEEVSDLLDVLEPFYEVVEDEDEDEDKDTCSKPAMSMFSGSRDEWRGSSEDDDDVEQEEEDHTEDVLRLTVPNRAEREGSLVCNGRVSSLSKSTHSSLNTDEEEEELEHSRDTSRDRSRDRSRDTSRDRSRDTSRASPDRFLQLLTDDGGDVSDPEQPSEVYGDSVRAEEGSGGLRAAAARAKKPEGRGGNTEEVGVSQDGKPQGAALPPLGTAAHGPVQSVILSAGRGRGRKLAGESGAAVSSAVASANDGTVGESAVTDSLNAQVVVALSRLQDDMQSALAKLRALEARAVSKVESLALCCEPHTALANKRPPTCPSVVSQISGAFLLIWPFVVHFLVQLYRKKKRKTKL